MKRKIKKGLTLAALGVTFTVFGANQGCDVYIEDGWDDDVDVYSWDGERFDEEGEEGDDEDETKNRLLLSGSGEFLEIAYNGIIFSARLNWDNGFYFFAPDPEGAITGDRIICAASVGEDEVVGDCFRSRRVCHFEYYHDRWADEDGKDVYQLGGTSCRKGGPVGPFLVPLDSPLCGEDPFPACPSEDIFPEGPGDEEAVPAVPVTPASPATPATPATPAVPANPATPATPATPAAPASPSTPASS